MKDISDSEGQGFHQEQSDKGITSHTFKGPGYDLGKMEGIF